MTCSTSTQTACGPRILFIDGLKGLCGIFVTIFHYILAFAAFGYIGWSSGIPDAEKASFYLRYFPYSVLSNFSFPLYVFFAIIAFLPAFRFFQNKKMESIQKQGVIRYFRLLPSALGSSLFSYAVFACGGIFSYELGTFLNNTWVNSFYTTELSLSGALLTSVWTVFWQGFSGYNSVLWCMNIILFGSYLSYGIIFFFGTLRARTLFYSVFWGISFAFPMYTAFLGGIVAADYTVRQQDKNKSDLYSIMLVIIGLVLGAYPEVLLPPWLTVFTLYGLGACLVLMGCAQSPLLSRLLSHHWLVSAGKYSFSLILTHAVVMLSFSAWFFLVLQKHNVSYACSLILVGIASAPVLGVVTYLFDRIVEQPTHRAVHKLYDLLCK